jgi:hypothetical protein
MRPGFLPVPGASEPPFGIDTPSILRGGVYLPRGGRRGNRSPDQRLGYQVDQGGSIPWGVGKTIVVEIHEDIPVGVDLLDF